MHDIQAQVLNVEYRTTKTGKTLWDVAMSDGHKYTTFENGVATQAQGLAGQQVQAQVDVSQNGQYTNYKLIAIRPANGAVVGSIVQLNPTAGPNHLVSPIPQAAPKGEGDAERAVRIVRQSSLATAFKFVGGIYTGAGPEALAEATEHAMGIAGRLVHRALHGSEPEGSNTPQQPSEVAAQVNEVLGTQAVTQGAPEATKDW